MITRGNELKEYVQTGELLDAELSAELLKSIFFKNAPLHDGAVIIGTNRIRAARCILPVSQNQEIEETGRISITENGKIKEDIVPEDLFKILESNPAK